MKVIGYAYEADTHCIPCTQKRFGIPPRYQNPIFVIEVDENGVNPIAQDNEGNTIGAIFDTDEADHPCHCSDCGVFLENALTDDGRKYVEEKLKSGRGDPFVLNQWKEFYGSQLSSS